MSRTKGRTERCGRAEARQRLEQARSYLLVAELVVSAEDLASWTNVAAGTAVLAAISAADAICCATIGQRWRGQEHERAADLLEEAVPDGKTLARALRRVLGVKDETLLRAHLSAAASGSPFGDERSWGVCKSLRQALQAGETGVDDTAPEKPLYRYTPRDSDPARAGLARGRCQVTSLRATVAAGLR